MFDTLYRNKTVSTFQCLAVVIRVSILSKFISIISLTLFMMHLIIIHQNRVFCEKRSIPLRALISTALPRIALEHFS